MLEVPFVFSSNGDGFLFHDRTGQSETVEREISLSEFPSPEALWRKYCQWRGLTEQEERIIAQEYYSDTHYFGEPVYTCSLKQGIEDGFLAPYKVVRLDFDKDLEGWRPSKGKKDKLGNEIEDRIYNQKDFDRSLVLERRSKLVAERITEFLKGINRFHKTIVFCEDIEHAERMRQLLVNENPEGVIGDELLDFINSDNNKPSLAIRPCFI